jgi:hypothetical protein
VIHALYPNIIQMYESFTGMNRSAPSAENSFKGAAAMYEDWNAEEVQVHHRVRSLWLRVVNFVLAT